MVSKGKLNSNNLERNNMETLIPILIYLAFTGVLLFIFVLACVISRNGNARTQVPENVIDSPEEDEENPFSMASYGTGFSFHHDHHRKMRFDAVEDHTNYFSWASYSSFPSAFHD
jgi:hypothetical protein